MLSQSNLQPVENIQLHKVVTRKQLVTVLKHLRKEWDKAAEGQSLVDMFSSVGLLLTDIINALELSQGEAMDILGFDLWAECQHLAGEVGKPN